MSTAPAGTGTAHRDGCTRDVVGDDERDGAGCLGVLRLQGEGARPTVGDRDRPCREADEGVAAFGRAGAVVDHREGTRDGRGARGRTEGCARRLVGPGRRGWSVDGHHVRETGERVGTGTDRVREAGVLVDGDVVRRAVPEVVRVDVVGRVATVPVAQPGEVEDLYPMVGVLGDDVSVVGEHLDVAPGRTADVRRGRQDAEDDGTLGVRDGDEDRAVRRADEGIVLPALRVGPAPDVVDEGRPELRVRDVAQHVDPVTREEVGGHASHAGREGARGIAALRRARVARARGDLPIALELEFELFVLVLPLLTPVGVVCECWRHGESGDQADRGAVNAARLRCGFLTGLPSKDRARTRPLSLRSGITRRAGRWPIDHHTEPSGRCPLTSGRQGHRP